MDGCPRSVDRYDRRSSRGYDRTQDDRTRREPRGSTRERAPYWGLRIRRGAERHGHSDERRGRRDAPRSPRESSVNAALARALTAGAARSARGSAHVAALPLLLLTPAHTSESEWYYSDDCTEKSSQESREESSDAYDSTRSGKATSHAAVSIDSAPSHRAPAARDPISSKKRGAGTAPRTRCPRAQDEDEDDEEHRVPRVNHVYSRRVAKRA